MRPSSLVLYLCLCLLLAGTRAQAQRPPMQRDTIRVEANPANTFVQQGIAGLSDPRPNPASEHTLIDYNLGPEGKHPATLHVYDFLGGEVMQLTLLRHDGSILLKVHTLEPGIYFYSLEAAGHILATRRLVVTR